MEDEDEKLPPSVVSGLAITSDRASRAWFLCDALGDPQESVLAQIKQFEQSIRSLAKQEPPTDEFGLANWKYKCTTRDCFLRQDMNEIREAFDELCGIIDDKKPGMAKRDPELKAVALAFNEAIKLARELLGWKKYVASAWVVAIFAEMKKMQQAEKLKAEEDARKNALMGSRS